MIFKSLRENFPDFAKGFVRKLFHINISSHFLTCPLMFLEISKPKGTTSVVWIINVFYFIFTREIQ